MVTVNRLLKLIIYFLLLLFIGMILFLFGYQKILQKQVQENYAIPPGGIERLEKVNLGEAEQWILIRGQNRENPLCLFLHGGPGAPLFTYARELGTIARLEEHFVMIYWEQRGAGKSFQFSLNEASMNVGQFVSDTYELTRLLKETFNRPHIYLMGRSWGSLIGMMTAALHPQDYYAFIGIGQLVYPLENDRLSYQYTLDLARQYGETEAVQELQEIGPPPFHYRDLLIQRRWLTRFYARKMEEEGENNWERLRQLLSTPDYNLWDIFKMGWDPFFSIKHLWDEELYRINLMAEVPRIEIPVYFFAGRYDYFTPPEIAEEYFKQLIAPRKDFFRFEHSGHEPELQEPEKFIDVIVNQILPATYNGYSKQ